MGWCQAEMFDCPGLHLRACYQVWLITTAFVVDWGPGQSAQGFFSLNLGNPGMSPGKVPLPPYLSLLVSFAIGH